MQTFLFMVFVYIVLVCSGIFLVSLNVKPVILQLIFFSVASCLPAFMNTYGHNLLVLGLFSLSLIGLLVAGLQVLGIVVIGPTGSMVID